MPGHDASTCGSHRRANAIRRGPGLYAIRATIKACLVAAIPATTVSELADRLQEPARKPSHSSKRPRLGFVSNGQGAQWHAMGRELIPAYPVFGQAIHSADEILKEYGAPWSLTEELMRDAKSIRVSEVHIGQPICVAVQLYLVDLLRS